MRIEILNTGSELLLGTTLNTHGQWFGRELFKLGLRVQRLTTVPDGDAIREALAESVDRADVVLVTGGLGPTSDDITREAAAAVLGVELIEDEAALRSLEEFFAKRNKVMVADNRKQAQVPVGADVLPNPNGTAPGIYVPPRLNGRANCAVFLLPGPPRELYPLFALEVAPRLQALGGIEAGEKLLELKFTGVGESEIHHEVDQKLAAVDGLEVGYCARLAEVDVRLIGSPAAVAVGREIVIGRFGECCFSEDGAELEEVVVRSLAARGWKLALAESCTGGLIASRVTDVAGSSAVLTHGFVTYANEAKRDVLGVSAEDLERHGAVSEPVARQMAEGALRVSGADVGLAVTGIAGPGGGTGEKPVGTVFLAIAVKGGATRVERQFHPRDRVGFKRAVSQAGLEMVRRVAHASGVREDRPENVAHSCGVREDRQDSGLAGAAGEAARLEACGNSRKPEARATKPVFRAFREDGEVRKTRRRLPHWQQEGATYFLTFRTADSMPKAVMDDWLRRRAEWLATKGIQVSSSGAPDLSSLSFEARREYDRVFLRTLQTELDKGHGDCLLRNTRHAETVRTALRVFDGSRYALGDFVIMPNHVHVLVVPFEGHELGQILKSWKSWSARDINAAEGTSGSFWQRESWDHIVRTAKQLERYRQYIAENPRVAGLGEGEFVFESCEWEIG